MPRKSVGSGFSLVEALVILVIIVVLAALLLPALQAHREASRRIQCNNNLHHIALSLQNYHDTYKVFPMGARHAGSDTAPKLGPSWWYGALPFMEQRNIYEKIAATQQPGSPGYAFCADPLDATAGTPNVSGTNGELARMAPASMRCPSSPLPLFETATGPIVLPTYVGIAGGCDIPNAHASPPETSPDYGAIGSVNEPPRSPRHYYNRYKGQGVLPGAVVTTSGMLPPCKHVRIGNCTDGTANTVIVSEQSEWLRGTDDADTTKYHGDPGWSTSGTATGGGFLSGTSISTRVPKVTPEKTTGAAADTSWTADVYNLTVVRYKPKLTQVMPNAPGCSENHGINNPLQSAHPGILLLGMTDGSVQSMSSTLDLAVMLRLAIRDDGQNVAAGN
jgi:type II secretory pathway pseudopilin PulG